MGYIYTKSGKLAKRLYFGAVLLFEGLYYTFKNRVLADGGTFVENELPTISQDAKLVLTPNAYKVGKLYSAVPNDGTGDFTVDRDSEATYTGQDGTRETALANVPRIDWSSGEAALLVEPQSTNLITYSQDFSDAKWIKNFITLGENTLIAPDGTLTASTITASNDVASAIYQIGITVTPLNTYIFSFYVKAGTLTTPYLAVYDETNSTFIKVNESYQITSDWRRIKIQFTTPTNCNSVRVYVLRNPPGIGDIYFWGVQLEQASTASSYIPTNGTTVTRLADDISVPTPAGVTSIIETINGVEQTPITTIPATYSLQVGNINKVTML